jgi:hypothetical protein
MALIGLAEGENLYVEGTFQVGGCGSKLFFK